MNILDTYQEQRLKEIILYILDKTGVISYYRLMKILFCAERRNLIIWGDQITTQNYEARVHGPVPVALYQQIYNLKNGRRNNVSDVIQLVDEYNVHSLRKADMEYLSKSDMDSLDYGISEIAAMDYTEIEKYLHDEVYNRLSLSKNRLYSQKDIAESGNASKEVLEWIDYQNSLSQALS